MKLHLKLNFVFLVKSSIINHTVVYHFLSFLNLKNKKGNSQFQVEKALIPFHLEICLKQANLNSHVILL